MFVTEMSVDLINLIRELGYDWGPAAVGLLLLWALIRYRWKKGHRGPKLVVNGPVLATCAVIVIGVFSFTAIGVFHRRSPQGKSASWLLRSPVMTTADSRTHTLTRSANWWPKRRIWPIL